MNLDMNNAQLNAFDTRPVLHPPAVSDAPLARPGLRPYPSQYVSCSQGSDGIYFTVRPIRTGDETLLADFHKQLSGTSVYLRFFVPLKLDDLVAHEGLFAECFIDYDREIAIVADHTSPETGEHEILAVARLRDRKSVV